MAEAAELVGRAVALPPGPELSVALGGLPWEKVPNARLVEVVQARSRQLAQAQAELLAGLVEIAHAVAVADLPREGPSTPASDRTGNQAGGGVNAGAASEAGQRAEAEAETGACHDSCVSHG
jgi:hypothetical protein